jgi:hypothetical protein
MIASIINISDLNLETRFQYASSLLSVWAMGAVVIAIGIEVYAIRAHKGNYALEEFTKSCGVLIEGLNNDTIIGRYWNPFNLIRWAITIVVMVFLNQHSLAQIFVLLAISVVFQIMMIIGKPMTDKWDHRMTWMVEVSISIYLYVLLSLTDVSD